MKGITLIGMSGSGKSTIGGILAIKLGWKFVDLDKLILEKQMMNHHDFMNTNGETELKRLEEEYTLALDLADTVFAPPGSLVYSPKAMEKVKAVSAVVYLKATPEVIERRLGPKLHANGIIGLKEKGLKKVMEERGPLYEKYADYSFMSSVQGKNEMADLIIKTLVVRGIVHAVS